MRRADWARGKKRPVWMLVRAEGQEMLALMIVASGLLTVLKRQAVPVAERE